MDTLYVRKTRAFYSVKLEENQKIVCNVSAGIYSSLRLILVFRPIKDETFCVT